MCKNWRKEGTSSKLRNRVINFIYAWFAVTFNLLKPFSLKSFLSTKINGNIAEHAWDPFLFRKISVFPRQFFPRRDKLLWSRSDFYKRNPLAFLRDSLQDVSSRRIWFIRKLISRESVAGYYCFMLDFH